MDQNKDLNEEGKLLFNGLLFCTLRLPNCINDKLSNLEKYLAKGADINAFDANDLFNSPLHIAVKMAEPEVVKFLLKKGANPDAVNKNKQKPIDLAKISKNILNQEIVNVLDTFVSSNSNQNKDFKQISISKNKIRDQPIKVKDENTNTLIALANENRSGAAGIKGQLYETKLLALLLHRAINDNEIDNFQLGANVTELGAFDDIVFKYYFKNDTIPYFFFVQAKHKENPTKQAKLTVQNLIHSKADHEFNLMKYYSSYINVRKKFNPNSKNNIFRSDFKNVDCKFIIYTSALEDFDVEKKKMIQIQNKEKLLITNSLGKTFMYQYDQSNLEVLLQQTSLTTAKSLGKCFAENIAAQKNKDNLKNIMWNDLIKVYHVFLALNVVHISNKESENYLLAKFRKSFLESTDPIIVYMKTTMLNVFESLKMVFYENLEFKLPKYFGNFGVLFNNEKYIKVVTKLIGLKPETQNTIVVDDNMVSYKNVFTKYDMKLIGNLVGEALIFDGESGLFKLNILSEKTRNLFEATNIREIELERLRFNINVQNFPQLTLWQHQKTDLEDFLNRLIFFTNQSREDEVENILKQELNDFYTSEAANREHIILVKSDAIYHLYHDRIQNWWKNPKKTVYLTKTCQYYKEAKENIVKSPLTDINNYLFIQRINSFPLIFHQKAIDALGLHTFMERLDVNILYIDTQDTILSSLKVKQYFESKNSKVQQLNNYKFIDINIFINEGDVETMLKELHETSLRVIIFVLSDDSNRYNDIQKKLISQSFKKKIIIISNSNPTKNIKCFIKVKDQNNSLSDLDTTTKYKLIGQQMIMYQGFNVKFMSIVDGNLYNLVKSKILHKIIKNDIIKIGKEPSNIEAYNEAKKFYVHRHVCRCLIMYRKQYINDFHIIYNDGIAAAKNDKDILIISNDKNVFEKNCKKHCNKNIHWFQKIDSNKIHWKKSNGSLKNIIPLVKRTNKCENKNDCLLQLQTLNQLNDRVVIISAGPGMGKSTLLTHVTMQTKQIDKTMCVIKINLIDFKNELNTWPDCSGGIKLNRLLSVLFTWFTNYQDKFNSSAGEIIFNDFNNRVHFNHKVENITSENNLALFEFQVFINLFNNNKMALVFDGFDEICPDYKKKAIGLFKLLLTSRIKNLWITSRSYNILNELESELNTFSYTLLGFTTEDQIGFLEKYWGNHISQRSLSSDTHSKLILNLNVYVQQFFNAISYKIKDHQKDFTCTPLHLLMIAEIFQTYFIHYYSYFNTPQFTKDLYDAFNLVTLYEKFIDIKFHKIRFGEKKDGLSLIDPDMKTVIEDVRSLFIENHMKLAAYAVFNKKTKNNENKIQGQSGTKLLHNSANVKHGTLTEDDLKLIRDFVQKLILGKEKTGFIEIVQNEPKFVHFSYAEYFASQFICDRLKSNLNTESTWMYMINHILVMDYEGVRGFIDATFEKDQILQQYTAKCISDALLTQRHTNKSALFQAVAEERDNIALFLLNNLNEYLTTKGVDDFIDLVTKKITSCTLCQIYDRSNRRLMTRVTEIIKRLNCYKLSKLLFCEDIPTKNIFMITFLFHATSFHGYNTDIILEYTNSKTITKLLTLPMSQEPGMNKTNKCPILHTIVQFRTDIYLLKYFQKLNKKQRMIVFCATDDLQRIPAHWAAIYGNFVFFDTMSELLEKDIFKTICTTTDKHGQIPLTCFGSVAFILDKYKTLCAKAGVGFRFKAAGGGWFLYDLENEDCKWWC